MTDHDSGGNPLTRRPVLKLLAGGAVAVAGVGVGVGRLSSNPGSGERPGLQLSSHDPSGVASLDIPLDSGRLTSLGGERWQSKQLPTSTHSMVAATWAKGARTPSIRIRSRIGGAWGEWRRLPTLQDLPDVDSVESTDVAGTDLIWIGAADGIQVDVKAGRPKDLTLVLMHPARVPGRTSFAQRSGLTTPTRAPRPELLRRPDWGAEKDWRPADISYNDTITQVHVHHTVNSNTYARDDVPGLIRGMYRYHTHNLGWSDIGYNFLVDRFGRTWVGRAGGARRPVRGAHTLGFNASSSGISAIGNYEITGPNDDVIAAIAALAAWKLDRYGATPDGHITVTSEGSDRFPSGRQVRLPVIDGHRDTNDTACPGRYLYEALPQIRRRAQSIVNRYAQS